jgi:hypothetical protein
MPGFSVYVSDIGKRAVSLSPAQEKEQDFI